MMERGHIRAKVPAADRAKILNHRLTIAGVIMA